MVEVGLLTSEMFSAPTFVDTIIHSPDSPTFPGRFPSRIPANATVGKFVSHCVTVGAVTVACVILPPAMVIGSELVHIPSVTSQFIVTLSPKFSPVIVMFGSVKVPIMRVELFVATSFHNPVCPAPRAACMV